MNDYIILTDGTWAPLQGCRIVETDDPAVFDQHDSVDALIEHAMIRVITEWTAAT